ncbi:hypothetical protein JHN59_40635 [Streptomyces sp. MBT49]|uniref:hypothetical protein n=1 Tax=unclassified Streptomyces TaxID=2593676 RepID=UPI00190CEC38|nr:MULTISPECIES: hypothetical protein [unclassified Streptomyces]MBK3630986.1 hypothetical protein [Streptomyces sp. MBT49]MBK3637845.1 hypothetical protein [Streptomyces sp. MBT97]
MPQHFATAAIVQAAPGYRELRVGIRRRGEADPFALIALPGTLDTPDALAAFGWRVVGDLEYVAGPNEERAEVEPCTPTEGAPGDRVRDTVRREIRARTIAILAHPTAAHFHPVQLNGDGSRDPIGWTFLAGTGDDRVHCWITAAGALSGGTGESSRADAKRAVRHAHMMQLGPSSVAEMASAQLKRKTGPELAEVLHIVRNGGQVAVEDDVQGEPEVPPYRRGDRIVCADGVTRTVEAMAPEIAGQPARVVVDGGAEWIADNCLRANREDVLAAHRRSHDAALRLRTGLLGSGEEDREAILGSLLDALSVLRRIDPTVRVALAEDAARRAAQAAHPDASKFQPVHHLGEEEPCAWSFSVGHSAQSRYGIVTRLGEVSPVGLYEYRTTAERAFRQHEEERTAS